jgi:hypothetical protein
MLSGLKCLCSIRKEAGSTMSASNIRTYLLVPEELRAALPAAQPSPREKMKKRVVSHCYFPDHDHVLFRISQTSPF